MKVESIKAAKFGATVTSFDCSDFAQSDIDRLRHDLHFHQLLIFPNQLHLTPKQEVSFYRALYPKAKTIWRDQTNNPWEVYKVTQGNKAGTYQVPDEPGVLVIGKGDIDHYGLKVTLGGNRSAYGSDKGSQVLGGGGLQWHIDGAFYDKNPCVYTQMRCIQSPEDAGFWLDYNDGSDDRIWCEAGATAFASGRIANELMNESEKRFCDQTSVHYAANPFQKHFNLENSSNGLRAIDRQAEEEYGQGHNPVTPFAEDPKAKIHPLIWHCPFTGKSALMPHPRCLTGLESKQESNHIQHGIIESREKVENLMRPAINPENVYVHNWQPGDLAIWYNHAIWHSATGGLSEKSKRIMHLTAFDGEEAPE